MDEVKTVKPQSSVCSDTNGEDTFKTNRSPDSRLCLIGNLATDSKIRAAAETFDVPIVYSDNGEEYIHDQSCSTIFVLENFEGDVYNKLYKSRQCLLGPLALRQLAKKKEKLPDNTRPLYNLAMSGVVVCFTGFRNKDELTKLVPLIHHMGGSIRKEMSARVTHLIANYSGGEKYQYAATFRLPVMNLRWVFDSWEHRNELDFSATVESFVAQHKLKPFHGAKVCFAGFPEEEEKHMTEVLLLNGGTVTNLEDPSCTHVVMEHAEVYTLEAASAPLSPNIKSPQEKPQPEHVIIATPPNIPKTPRHNGFNSNRTLTNCFKMSQSVVGLETLHESSRDGMVTNELDSICFDQSFDPNITPQTRKRKISPELPSILIKRKRDKSYSEKKKKVSEFFKTPINYFSNRRRTIDASSFNQSLNESVISSSGVFGVETVQNLSCFNESEVTPRTAHKRTKKNLFARTFSSSKFARMRSRKNSDLNATKLSFSETNEMDGKEKMNASCFPDISLNPAFINTRELSSEKARVSRRTSVPAVAVVDESSVAERPDGSSKAFVVKAEWFWTSVQKEVSLSEKEYLFDDYVEQVLSPSGRRDSHVPTPSSASRRKRKRLHETLSSLVQTQSPALTKRRSSVSDAALLSVSGSFLDCTASPGKDLDESKQVVDSPRKGLTPRHQVFLELVQTESNYVNILKIIIEMFKKYLEEMPDEEALLNNTELNLIFGKVPPIYELHVKIRDELQWTLAHWTEERRIGETIVKYKRELQKAYPPYINYFEEMKEVLTQCDQNKPRFHAFLKACQTKPECGRQSLQELMIRPVQRLGSITLLLHDILKNTPKTNPDHESLENALATLREVMTHINEDKRKAEGQVTLFNIFNDIDHCPPDIVSSHRSLITKAEVVQLSSSEGLASKGTNLVLFLFTDQLEVCKKKSKAFNTLKSPSTTTSGALQNRQLTKPYKHIRMMALNTIKRVIDIKETEECQKVFSLVCRNNDDLKEKLYSFAMVDEEADKAGFLKTLTRQMANYACTADAEKFMAYLEPHQLDIDTSDINNGTLSKAFKFATTKFKVGRAFSFNKTPSKLKRAVSSMMSPFGSSTNLTPASQLANMKLASYSNLNELGNTENSNESLQVSAPLGVQPPLSVQPTRKMKSSSLGVNSVKRL